MFKIEDKVGSIGSWYLYRSYIIQKNKRLRNIDRILKVHGIKAIFCLRLSPVLPIYLFSYILGGFDSTFFLIKIVSNYIFLVSAYGGLPGVMFDVYLGYSASQLGEVKENRKDYKKIYFWKIEVVSTVIFVMGLLILLVMICILNRYSQDSFQQLVEEEKVRHDKEKKESIKIKSNKQSNKTTELVTKE